LEEEEKRRERRERRRRRRRSGLDPHRRWKRPHYSHTEQRVKVRDLG